VKHLPLMTVLALLGLTLVLYRTFQHRVSDVWFELATHPRLRGLLEAGGEDLKTLALLDPEHRETYRTRFDEVQEARRTMLVLLRSRERMVSRYELLLSSGMGIVIVLAIMQVLLDRRSTNRRLTHIRAALDRLARGEPGVVVGSNTRGLLGRIGSMIEETATIMGEQRRRLTYLDHLGDWQHAARRIAHEIRTPLSTLSLVIARLEAGETRTVMREELGRLEQLAHNFASFAGIGQPRPTAEPVRAWLEQLVDLYREAWHEVHLKLVWEGDEAYVAIDRAMAREVIAILCNNAATANGDRETRITLSGRTGPDLIAIDVSDDGPGIDPAVRDKIFQPYATTRASGGGLGLGLAIARKIMLEHDGDLELVTTGPSGTRFRLTFPREATCTPSP